MTDAAGRSELAAQRNFVVWWDGQEKQAGALKQGKELSRRRGSATPELKDFGLDRDTVSRWRKRLKGPRIYLHLGELSISFPDSRIGVPPSHAPC